MLTKTEKVVQKKLIPYLSYSLNQVLSLSNWWRAFCNLVASHIEKFCSLYHFCKYFLRRIINSHNLLILFWSLLMVLVKDSGYFISAWLTLTTCFVKCNYLIESCWFKGARLNELSNFFNICFDLLNFFPGCLFKGLTVGYYGCFKCIGRYYCPISTWNLEPAITTNFRRWRDVW